jgi:raffinose/stachyose/melibiose transport system permease protein
MVISKFKSKVTFAIFLLPALVLYLLFAIVPLFQGMWLSTTNWDGTAPWTPAQLSIADFETNILPKIGNAADRDLLLKYYVKDAGQGTYRKQELIGLDRYRVMSIFNAAGFVNKDFKSVGLQNYADILAGKLDSKFFPESYQEKGFQAGGELDAIKSIPRNAFEADLAAHVKDQADREWLSSVYHQSGDSYILDGGQFRMSELEIQSALAETPGLEDDWEKLFNDATALGETGKARSELAGVLSAVPAIAAKKIAASSQESISSAVDQAWLVGKLKSIVSQNWWVQKTKMGVIVFTIVFVIVNVILVNVLGLLLALALDNKLRSRNLLRSVFYIPNVLSMIIVAFIWQLVFTQLLPAVTGMHEWLMNPDLAPWLTIVVATWQGVGYYMIIYLAGLQSIPTDIVESASIDGASGFRRFSRIVMPLLVPAITICLFLSISGALKTFDILFALYPSNSTAMGVDNIAVNIFFDAFRDKHAGLATAKAFFLMVIIMVISGTQLVLTKRKEVEL